MVVDTETVCEILVKERADVAGEVAVNTKDLLLVATGEDSTVQIDDQRSILQRVYQEDITEITACVLAATEENKPQQTKSRVQLSADEWCIFEFSVYPANHFSEETGLIFTGRNVTHDHFASQRREVINRVLRHNLRNDAEVASGYLDIIREQCAEASHPMIDNTNAIVENLLSLGEKMREIDSRLNSSNYRLRRVYLREITERVVAKYHQAHPAVTFRVNVGDYVVAGNSLLADALEELVENAIEHSEIANRETVITVATEASANNKEIKLIVTDNGDGIPKGEADAISEATESKLNHSSGVGLWLVKWITDSIYATFEIGQRQETHGTRAVLGLRNADELDDTEKQQVTDLQQKKIIRTELPDTGSSEMATSTRE